jgi:hypothetical protein
MKPKPKPKPPTAAQYKRLQREASDWRECAWMLLGQLMGTGADTRKSGACTHYDYLTRTTSVPWPKRYPHGYKPKPLPTDS